MRRCSECLQEKPEDLFPAGDHGRGGRCKACRAAYVRKRYKSLKPPLRRTAGGETMKRCSYCWTWKRLTEFSPHPRGRCGRQSRCRQCRRLTTYQFKRPPGAKRRSSKYRPAQR